MTNPRSVQVKARAVLRQLGHTDGDHVREFKDWHIEVRGGTSYVSIWHSGEMVFFSMSNIPVYHRAGSWEEYLDRLFQRTTA